MPAEDYFARELQRRREAAGLSQYALAKRTGLSKQSLSKLEMGERVPRWPTGQRLCLGLGVDCRAFAEPGLTLPGVGEKGRGRKPKVKAEQAAPKKPRQPGKGKPKK